MSPTTHLLASWAVADSFGLSRRDRNLVTWCGLLPDLDGFGLGIDLANDVLCRPETAYYHIYHHTLLHGLLAAVLLPGLAALFARQHLKVLALGLFTFHLHLLADLLGSRGPAPTDLWSIPYLAPFSTRWTFQWAGQWRLDGWQNFVITFALLGLVLIRAFRRGYSPVSIFGQRADGAFMEVLRKWRGLVQRRFRG
jgi:inner membrane protein